MTAVIWVNLKRAMGDRRLLIIGTLVPVVIILITGLLEGNPKEPIGLLHPSARLLHLAESTNGVRVRVEANRTDLTDDILRGRVVAGIVQLPSTTRRDLGSTVPTPSGPTSWSSRPPPTPSRPAPTWSH